MLGAAVMRALRARGVAPVAPTSDELDLTQGDAVRSFIAATQPDAVVHTAGRVGGIAANVADPVGFLTENMAIGMNVIGGCHEAGVPRLINVSSSCMYPKDLQRPLVEEDVLTGPLEPTNEGYALAKIAGDRLCAYIAQTTGRAYRTIVPSNLYGPGDHFDEQRGHLVANAIRKVEAARRSGLPSVEVWGDGTARREFTYVDDVADWISTLTIDGVDELPLRANAGVGVDYTVREYYEHITQVCGYDGDLSFDLSKPAGMARKLMDSGRARAHGWNAPTSLDEGLTRTVEFYREQVVSG
jgi:GDP-L-fucose synthase